MAQYNILNPELKTIAAGKQNAGQKYLYASLQNKNCIWETPKVFTSFNQNIVKAYEQLLPIEKGGVAKEAQSIPTELTTIMGHWVDYIPEQKFYKQHLSDHLPTPPSPTNPQGRPAIKAGEIVKKNGVPIIYSTLRVFCVYYYDEKGEKHYAYGESPTEVGMRAFNAYCIPISTDSTPQATEEPIPVVTASQSAQPAPQVQQPVQQPAQPQFVQQPNPAQPGGQFAGAPF